MARADDDDGASAWRMVDRVMRTIQFMPALPFRAWASLWTINLLMAVVHCGGVFLDYWQTFDTLAALNGFMFVLLGLTPLRFAPRVYVVWLIAGPQTADRWMEVGPDAAQLIVEREEESEWRVRRLTFSAGKLVDDQHVQ